MYVFASNDISPEAEEYNHIENSNSGKEVNDMTNYERPSASRIINDLMQQNPSNLHPRLMASKERFGIIKELLSTDENMKDWYRSVKAIGETALTDEPIIYEIPDGLRLPAGGIAAPRIYALALLYIIEKDDKYAERIWLDLDAATKFSDWNPRHFLDTATMTSAFAIAYDWLYDYWSDEQKNIIRSAIIEKGLKEAKKEYDKGASWTQSNYNWNIVCNSGIAMGALAVGDEEPEIAGELLERGLRAIEYVLPEFAPDGAWEEGPGYWRYLIQYFATYMASMDSALGTSYGYFNSPGIAETGFFPAYISGEKETFNFHDSGTSAPNSPELFWFSQKLNNDDLHVIRLDMMKQYGFRGSVMDMLWYVPHDEPKEISLSLDKYYRKIETVTLRDHWQRRNAVFAGLHAGKNDVGHSHLDVGTFVFDALGERWACDLGSEDYAVPNYFSLPERWDYYRTRAEGQNVLVINPDSSGGQNPNGGGDIVEFHSGEDTAYAIADMTAAYSEHANYITRKMSLSDNRGIMTIQDSMELKQPSEVWWFMHTKADVSILSNGKVAVLYLNNKRVLVQLTAAQDGILTVMDAVPMPNSPNPNEQNENSGIRKLAIQFTDVEELNFSVKFTPLAEPENDYWFFEDFQDMDNVEGNLPVGWFSEQNTLNKYAEIKREGKGENKYLYAKMNGVAESLYAKKPLESVRNIASAKRIVVAFDVRTDSEASTPSRIAKQICFTDGTNTMKLMNLRHDKKISIYNKGTEIPSTFDYTSVKTDSWLEVRLALDTQTGMYTGIVNGTPLSNKNGIIEGTYNTNISRISDFQVYMATDASDRYDGFSVDNIRIYPVDSFELSDSIPMHNSERVDVDDRVIAVFNSEIDARTLNPNDIIVNGIKGRNVKSVSLHSLDLKSVLIEFSNPLESDTEYTIEFPGIRDIFNSVQQAQLRFRTKPAGVSVKSVAFYKEYGNPKQREIFYIEEGDITAEIWLKNSHLEEKTVDIIIANYYETSVKNVESELSCAVDGGKEKMIKFSFSVQGAIKKQSVKVFAWESLSNMIPLVTEVPLPLLQQ